MKFSCCSLEKEEMIQLAELAEQNQEATRLFKLLAHPIRLAILQILVLEEEICTTELAALYKELKQDDEDKNFQPAITKQLTKLRKENILTIRKITFREIEDGQWEKEEKDDGKWTAYRLSEEKKPLITYLLKPFIGDKFQPKLPDCEPKLVIHCGD